MPHARGEIVLVPFPFTDLSTSKVRPALVMSTSAYATVSHSLIVAMITSVSHSSDYDYQIIDWQDANLLYPSWVRMKLATLDLSLVRYTIGTLSDSDKQGVQARLKTAFGW